MKTMLNQKALRLLVAVLTDDVGRRGDGRSARRRGELRTEGAGASGPDIPRVSGAGAGPGAKLR